MTRQEYLVLVTIEECNEVAHRLSKLNRFGRDECQPGQDMTNAERVMEEWLQLRAMIGLLVHERVLDPPPGIIEVNEVMTAKVLKVEKYLEYSRACGTVTNG